MQLSDKRVLVTGGAGFIGSHVTRELLARGADVHIVDDLSAGRIDLIPDEAMFDEVDLRSGKLKSIIKQSDPDAALHLAAIHHVPYCNDHPEEAFDVNVIGTRNLLTALEQVSGFEKLVFTSSAAVYPPRDQPNAETTATGPIDVYGKSKLIGEDLLELFARTHDATAVAARVFNVYGPNETNPHVIPDILEQLDGGNKTIELGNLSPKRDFIHVTDVADALIQLLTTPTDDFRVYNVGTGSEHSVRVLVDHVSDAINEQIEIVQAQDRVRESDRPHLCADISRIEDEINWTPTTNLPEGLRSLIATNQIIG